MSKDGRAPAPAFIDLAAQRARMGERLDRAVLAVLGSGQYILGPQVAELERELAAFSGAAYVVSCANGTDALQLVLMAEGVGPGDAVFVPAFTFLATAEVPALVGATPVFVDIDPDTFNMDIESLDAAIGDAKARGLKPRCIIPVDLYGQPADYDAIHALAKTHGLLVLADAAQSFGASLGGKKVGTLAPYTGTSFYPSKPLGGYGDGGAIFLDDGDKAKLLVSLRCHGKAEDGSEGAHIGLNSRLDSIQAVILSEKLRLFPDEIVARQEKADRYAAGLRDVVKVPQLAPGRTSVWAQYTIVTEHRDAVARGCRAAGVPTAIHYVRAVHQLPAYRDFPTAPGGLPAAERLAGRVISLPMHPYLTDAMQDLVIGTVREAVATASAGTARAAE